MVASSLMFVACDTPVEGENPNAPKLSVTTETTVEFAAEGGEGEIAYAVENGVEGVYVTATSDAEWITDIAVAEKVTFVVATNEGEAREAKIVVAYGELSVDVAVKQAAKGDAPAVDNWAVVGSMTNDWDVAAAMAMECVEGYYVLRGFEVETTDGFIFICNGDTSNTRSGNGEPAEADHGYFAQSGGSDIRVAVSGVYDLYLSDDLALYYLMSEGADPADAIAPEVPVTNTWSVLGNFEGNSFVEDVSMVNAKSLYVAHDVIFAAEGDAAFRVRKGLSDREEHNYGVRTKVVREVGEEIQLYAAADKGRNDVLVNVERGVKYDIYFEPSTAMAWVMPDGVEPVVEIRWSAVEGVQFSANNFGVFMYSTTHNLYFDFNSGEYSTDGTIPEGTYYVNDVDNTGNNFNDLGLYTLFTIYGIDTYPMDGTLEVEHISGGYRLSIKMTTAHMDELDIVYEGKLSENTYMGRPITNPM